MSELRRAQIDRVDDIVMRFTNAILYNQIFRFNFFLIFSISTCPSIVLLARTMSQNKNQQK